MKYKKLKKGFVAKRFAEKEYKCSKCKRIILKNEPYYSLNIKRYFLKFKKTSKSYRQYHKFSICENCWRGEYLSAVR